MLLKNVFCFIIFPLLTANLYAQQNRVLTQDLVLTDHTPIGTADAPFTDSFYGNGFTVTIKSFAPGVTGNFGFFGVVGEGAVIRDLTVVYETTATLTVRNFGGIAATAEGAQFINVLVKGAVTTSNIYIDMDSFANIGGMVGQLTGGGTITNAYSGIALTVGGEGPRNVGGFIGHNQNSDIEGVTFDGALRTSGTVNGVTRLGGIIGYNHINADGSYTIDDCLARGNIDIDVISTINIVSTKRVGGIIGQSNRASSSNGSITITNSFFEAGEIAVKGTFITDVGGFSGLLAGTHTISNCGTLGGIITVDTTSGSICVGGFTSDFNGTVSDCFSKINIITNSAGIVSVGGFIGQLQTGSSSISGCYAAGSVRSVQNGDAAGTGTLHGVNVGGLVGRSLGTINNSYALGNVAADKQGGNGEARAGGLVGYQVKNEHSVDPEPIISNCFSAGQVTAQSDSSEVYAGGIVGRRDDGTISDTAALGASVTAKGGTRHAGRITGYPADATVIGSNNRAKQSMRVEEGDYTQTLFSNLARSIGEGDAEQRHGETYSDSTFFLNGTWTGLGFLTTHWSFSNIAREGFPRLAGLEGQ